MRGRAKNRTARALACTSYEDIVNTNKCRTCGCSNATAIGAPAPEACSSCGTPFVQLIINKNCFKAKKLLVTEDIVIGSSAKAPQWKKLGRRSKRYGTAIANQLVVQRDGDGHIVDNRYNKHRQ